MEFNGSIYISPNHLKSEYKALHLSISSEPAVWQTAVEIFDDRIAGRYLQQIELLSNNVCTNGFAIMALNCLLIETLLQFKEGLKQTPVGMNGSKYATFLQTEFPVAFDSPEKAIRFYQDIRCGILHSAQTKGKTMLTCDNSYVVRLDANKIFSVSVEEISALIKSYFEAYKQKLLTPTEHSLRDNFIKKMKFVCKE